MRFVRSAGRVLSEQPGLLFQQAINEPDGTAPARIASARLAAGLETRPWLRWLHKPQTVSSCLLTLSGHAACVISFDISPDGRRIASISEDNVVNVWDFSTGSLLLTLVRQKNMPGWLTEVLGRSWIWRCAFSDEGTRIIAATDDGRIREWDATTGDELRAFKADASTVSWSTGPSYSISDSGVSSDGTKRVSLDRSTSVEDGTFGGLTVVATGVERPFFILQPALPGIDWAARIRRLLPRLEEADLAALAAGKDRAAAGHAREILACAFSPDGSRLVTASADRSLRVWDLATGGEMATFYGHAAAVTACAFSPDGAYVVSSSNDGTLKVWDATVDSGPTAWLGHADAITDCTCSPDGHRFLSASLDKTLKLWDAATGTESAKLIGHREAVASCAFSPDGSRVASGSGPGDRRASRTPPEIRLWNLDTGEARPIDVRTGRRTSNLVWILHRAAVWIAYGTVTVMPFGWAIGAGFALFLWALFALFFPALGYALALAGWNEPPPQLPGAAADFVSSCILRGYPETACLIPVAAGAWVVVGTGMGLLLGVLLVSIWAGPSAAR